MIYCDTSLIVTALTAEGATLSAQRWLAEHEPAGLCVSPWVETEVASALAQKQRTAILNAAQRSIAFARWLEMRSAWRMLTIEARHFVSAAELTREGLRAGDALHLAVVLDHGAALATRDDTLARVALTLDTMVHRLT